MVNVGRATVDVDAELDRTSIAALGKKIEMALGNAGDKAGSRFSKQFNNASGRAGGLFKIIVASAPLAASAISALSGSVVALSASLFNAVSSSAALTGILGSLGQTAVVATIGFRNFGKAIVANNAKKFNEAIAHMAPSMINAVKAVRSLSGEYFKFTRSLQTAIFDDTSKQINKLASVFLPLLQKRFTRTGEIINHVFDSLVRFGTSTPFLTQFGKALQGNNKILSTLGRAVVPAVAGILHVFLALQPASERLSLSIVRLAKQFQIVTRQTGFAKGVDAFMIRASASAKLLLTLTGNLGGALFNIFSAATPAGDSFLQTLVNITQRFQDFTASAKGKSSIATWAANGVAAIKGLGAILGKLGTVFSAISDPKILAAFTQLLTSFANTLITISPLIQSFSLALASIVAKISPALGPALAFAAAFALISSTLSVVGSTIGFLIGPMFAIFKILKVVGVVVRVAALAFQFLGAALLANPVVLITLAIVALGAALVIAYKKSQTFRDIVNGALTAVKTAAVATFGALQTAASAVWGAITTGFNVVVSILKVVLFPAIFAIRLQFTLLAIAVLGSFMLIKTAAVAVFNFLLPFIKVAIGLMVAQFKIFRSIVVAQFNVLKAVAIPIFNAISIVARTAFSVAGAAVSKFVSVAKPVLKGIKKFLDGLFDGVASGAAAAFGAAKSIINSVIRGINAAIKPINKAAGFVHAPKVPVIPELAVGARNFRGGVALVGEKGPELVDIPGGSDVHTASDTRGILGSAGAPIVYSPNFYGPTTSSARLRELDWTIRYATAARSEKVVV